MTRRCLLIHLSTSPHLAAVQHEDAFRHAQRRVSDLLHKADAVDKTEYERVTSALKTAEEQLASLQADVARLQPLADQLPPLQAKVSALEVCAVQPCRPVYHILLPMYTLLAVFSMRSCSHDKSHMWLQSL